MDTNEAFGLKNYIQPRRAWHWTKDLPEIVWIPPFFPGNGTSGDLQVCTDEINHCWLTSSRSWFDIPDNVATKPPALGLSG